MTNAAIIGLVFLVAFVAAGLCAYAAIQRAAYPTREELFQKGAALLRRPGLAKRDRDLINFLMDDALEFRAGWIILQAAFRSLSDSIVKRPPPPVPARTADFEYILVRFIISALAANPIACMLVFPMAIVQALRERSRTKVKLATAHYVPDVARQPSWGSAAIAK